MTRAFARRRRSGAPIVNDWLDRTLAELAQREGKIA